MGPEPEKQEVPEQEYWDSRFKKDTLWDVKVKKTYTETIQVSAVTSIEAYNEAMKTPGVIRVEDIKWNDPDQEFIGLNVE